MEVERSTVSVFCRRDAKTRQRQMRMKKEEVRRNPHPKNHLTNTEKRTCTHHSSPRIPRTPMPQIRPTIPHNDMLPQPVRPLIPILQRIAIQLNLLVHIHHQRLIPRQRPIIGEEGRDCVRAVAPELYLLRPMTYSTGCRFGRHVLQVVQLLRRACDVCPPGRTSSSQAGLRRPN